MTRIAVDLTSTSSQLACPDVWSIRTPGTDLAVPVIRAVIHTALTGRDAYTVELVASEMATNAHRHSASGQGGTIQLDLEVTDNDVTVHVTDDGPKEGKPAALKVDLTRVGGMGLTIVKALAAETGEYTGEDGRRHTVWARIECPPDVHPPGEPET